MIQRPTDVSQGHPYSLFLYYIFSDIWLLCASAITNEITIATASVSEYASERSNMTQKYA